MSFSKLRQVFIIQVVIVMAFFLGCSSKEKKRQQQQNPKTQIKDSDFPLNRGTNIAHWLSQSERRGKKRKHFFTKKDVKRIANMGFDFIRIPIDEVQIWDKQGNKHEEAFHLLHSAIRWCEKYGLRVIIDLHYLRSHNFNLNRKSVWTSSSEQEKFIGFWRDLSHELHTYSTDSVAYELLNEPAAPNPDEWNQLASRVIKAIRKKEPKRKMVIGSNEFENTNTFDDLKVPKNDPNIILSFHFYTPILVTHHEASWIDEGDYKGPVHYPGKLVKDSDIVKLPKKLKEIVQNHNDVFTKDSLKKLIIVPLRKAQKLDLQVFCGEFGVYSKTPNKVRYAWYKDVQNIFTQYNIGYANWCYKSKRPGFGLLNTNGKPDKRLINILTK